MEPWGRGEEDQVLVTITRAKGVLERLRCRMVWIYSIMVEK